MNIHPKVFVLVSDDVLLARALTQAIGVRAVIETAHDVASAMKLCAKPSVRGIVVDAALLKTSAPAQIEKLRSVAPLAGLLFVAGQLQGSLLNDLQPLRVEIVARPLPPNALALFVDRTLCSGRLTRGHMRAWIEEFAVECRLSRNDLSLMPVVLEEETPAAFCARLGIEQPALTRGLRRLVKKCRVRNTDRLAKNLMRDAFLFSRDTTAELIEPMSSRAVSF